MPDSTKQLLNKVPEITLYFWVIKVLCTTIGETAADFLNVNLDFGLTGTSLVTGALLMIALFFQFKAERYIPSVYWLAVTLVSVFGTLVTDNLTDRLSVPLETSTIVFGILLATTFAVWYRSERTLSIHSIFTRTRETFYWLAILVTFALGTASGDLMAEGLGLGYFTTGMIVAVVIAMTALAWRFRLNSVLSFWIIYILTRPLGASIGDLLSQSRTHGGFGLGATTTSFIFLGSILAIVTYLSITKRDVITAVGATHGDESKEQGGLFQTGVVLALFIVAGILGYGIRHRVLEQETPATIAPLTQSEKSGTTTPRPLSPLGDLTQFRTITQDTLDRLEKGDQSGATTRIGDLEYEWDNAESRLRPKDRAAWTLIDGKIDTVLRQLRAVHPNSTGEEAALTALLGVLE
jgi:uncharacterized membrane-anchored protein